MPTRPKSKPAEPSPNGHSRNPEPSRAGSGGAALDTEAFRQRLAGLIDPLGPRGGAAGREANKNMASRLCSILASLYNVSDDRMKLWEHVGKALSTALDRTADDDVDHFLSLCLESIQADLGQAAACDALTAVTCEVATWSAEQRHDFLGYLRSHLYSVLTFGRQRWEQVKRKEVEL